MKLLNELKIHQPYIALFGSGSSVHDLNDKSFDLIKSQAFVITINYAPIHLQGHLNMWSDRRVSDFLEKHYSTNPKNTLLLTQKHRVSGKLKTKIDYFFSRRDENLKGNYTIVWALQLLQKYFPDKVILLFGVDMYTQNEEGKWYDRYTDYDKSKRGKAYNINSKLDQCARQITQYCQKDKVINCNPKSQLSYFEKKDWESFFRLKVLHLCSTPLAGAPSHLSKIINKYTACESVAVLKNDLKGAKVNQLRWDYDVTSPSRSRLQELVDWADIVHFHRKVYPVDIGSKTNLIQYHSPPRGYKPGHTDSPFNGKKLVIAQYHPRYYTDAFIVPNLIDIWDELYLPGKKSNQVVKIFYSWATEIKRGWSDKGSQKTIQILDQIKQKYGKRVEIKIMNNQPYSICMREKQTAHICIDECVTGSYHLQSLEGCSVGALTFNNIDDPTQSYLTKVTGQAEHPFLKTNLQNLFDHLCYYIENSDKLAKAGQEARHWMEQHWNPKNLVHRYLKAYYDVLHFGKIQTETTKEEFTRRTGQVEKKSIPKTIQKRPKIVKPEKVKPYSKNLRERPATPGNTLAIGKKIFSLFQQFQNKDIYIFGNGPSLFQINPEDYKDKICFGINFSFEFMPYMDYIFVHVIETYQAIQKVVDNRKLVLPDTLVRQWYRDSNKNIKPNRIQTQNEKAYIYPCQNPAERNINKKHVLLEKGTEIFTWSTTTHSAIHLAAYMGAKNIFLIGVDYQLFPNGKVHFESKYSSIYGTQNWNANRKHRQGDLWLANQLKMQGVSLINLSDKIIQSTNSKKKFHLQPI